MSADQYAAESGVEYTGVDIAGASFLVRLVHLVVCAGIGTVGFEYSLLDEGHGLGIKLQPGKGPTQGKQKSLFR